VVVGSFHSQASILFCKEIGGINNHVQERFISSGGRNKSKVVALIFTFGFVIFYYLNLFHYAESLLDLIVVNAHGHQIVISFDGPFKVLSHCAWIELGYLVILQISAFKSGPVGDPA
jgi:hypothetical protein